MIPRHLAIVVAGLLAISVGRVEAAGWLDARAAIEELASAGEYEAAIKLEESLHSLVIEEFGETSLELAESYMFMASLYAANRDRFTAEDRILVALDVYEAVEGPLSTRLIEPFVALGDTYYAAGEFDRALAAYNEARILGRRAYGLLNREQLALLDKMSDATLALRQFDEAQQLRLEALTVVQRAYGEDSVENVDAHFDYAEWLSAQHRFRSADDELYRLGRIVRAHFEDDPNVRIRLYRAGARNFRKADEILGPQSELERSRQQRTASAEGLGHRTEPGELLSALELYDEFELSDPLLRAELLIELGDWYVHYNRIGSVDDPYVEAWHLLGEVDRADALREQYFSGVNIIRTIPLNSRVLAFDEDAPWGNLKLEFTILADGRGDDFVVIEADPPEMLEDAAIRQIRESKFRPHVEDGVVVETKGVVAWTYQYRER